jgi:hypothetical protein
MGIYTRYVECMISVNMKQHQNTTSVTIDELVPPSWRSTDVQGLGPERIRFERIGPEEIQRGDR